jgi:hypothetical protein
VRPTMACFRSPTVPAPATRTSYRESSMVFTTMPTVPSLAPPLSIPPPSPCDNSSMRSLKVFACLKLRFRIAQTFGLIFFCPNLQAMRASLGLVGLVLVLAASLRGAHGAPGSIPAVYALLDRVLPANTSSLFQLQLTADLTVRFLHSATLFSSQVMNYWLGQPPARAVHPPQVCFYYA